MVCKDIVSQFNKNKVPNLELLIPDWRTLDINSPYLDGKLKKYFITVSSNYEKPSDKNQLEIILNDSKKPGIEGLLNVYGKESSEQNINKLLKVVESPAWFVPERPNPKCNSNGIVNPIFGMKILISVPSKDLDSLPFRKNNKTESKIPQANSEINLISSEVKERILDASKKISNYAAEVNGLKGASNISFTKEAIRLQNFVPILENLLISNGFQLRQNQSDLIIIGLDKNKKVLYVLFDNGESFINLTNNFKLFLKSKPVSNDRTIRFLTHLKELNDMEKASPTPPLLDFLKNFTERAPKIKLGIENTTKDLNKILSNTISTSTKEIIFSTNKKSVKTEDDIKSEDKLLSSPDFKLQIYNENKKVQDFVGDTVLNITNFNHLIENVNSLEDVYEQVLNKVSVKSIAQMALKCFPVPEPCVILRAFLRKLKPNELVQTLGDKAGINIITLPELEPIFRAGINTCVDSLSVEEKLDLFQIITVKSNIQVNNVSDLIGVPLKTLVEVFQGKNIFKNIIAENLFIEILDATIKGFCARVKIKTKEGKEFEFNFNIDLDVELPKIPKFEIPTINLDDLLPTIDIMSSIAAQIENTLIDTLVSVLVGMIKNILKGILENCGDLSDKNFGAVNLNDILAKSVKMNVNSEGFLKVKGKLLNNLNIGSDIEKFSTSFSNLLDDTSSLLSPTELSNLLNGSASEESILIMNCLTETKYQALQPLLDNPSKIEDLFQSFGDLIDKQLLLDQIAQRNDVFGVVKEFCEPVNNDGRRKLLENKGLTPDLIDEQVALSNQIKSDKINNLLDILNRDNSLNDLIPPVFCKGNNALANGMIPRDHPSFSHMLNKTVDVIYDGVNISFNNEISSLPVALRETATIQVPREISRKQKYVDPEGNSREIENPEFRRLVSQGVSIEEPENLDGKPIVVWEDQNLTAGFVAKGLKNNLENIEFDSKLFSINKNKISFNIPNNLNDKVLTNTNVVLPAEAKIVQNQIGSFQTISNRIDYILSTTPDLSKDEYQLIIEELNNNVDSKQIFNISKSVPLDSKILSFIQKNNLDLSSDISLPQSYFSSLVSKIWNKEIGTSNNTDLINGTFRNNFNSQIYNNLFVDIFSFVTRQVSKSDLFNINILSLINFTPDKNNKCQPHLLDLDSVKQKMKDDFKNSECSEDIMSTSNGLGKTKLNSLEQSGVSGAVTTFIRLFTIELLLKSIFVFSEFKLSDFNKIDDVVVTYFIKNIRDGIQDFSRLTNDSIFIQQFNDQVIKTYNTKTDNETNDLNVAFTFLIKEQIISVFEVLTTIIGAKGNIDIHKIFIEEMLPLFEVPDGSIRFASKNSGKLTNLKQSIPGNLRKDYQTLFNLENGSLILERYIRIKDKINVPKKRKSNLFDGVVTIKNFENYISFNSKIYKDDIENWSYGLRLVYVLPTKDSDFSTQPTTSNISKNYNKNSITYDLLKDESNTKISESTKKNKTIRTFEGTNCDVDGTVSISAQSKISREINSFPLISVEIPETDINNVNIEQKWLAVANNLKEMLLQSDDFKFLFDLCLPLNRMISLATIYNIVYLSNVKKIISMFDGTKTNLKTVFQALLNSGNYQYEDPYIDKMGGNSGLATTSNNNENTEPQIPGLSLATIAARTPLLILKGLVELTDINIGRARKIVEEGKEHNEKVSMVGASLGQLPMNIVPPPPFGPGIGPPITPLGFLYLSMDIDGTFDSAKGKDVKRNEINTKLGLNFNNNSNC